MLIHFVESNILHFSNFVTQQKACKGKSQGKAMCLGNLSYKQCQSALKHLFCMSDYNMKPNFFKNLKQFTKDIQYHIVHKEELEGYTNIIGKKKMGFDIYKKIRELFLKEEGKEFIFASIFCPSSGISLRDPKMWFMHTFCTLSGMQIPLCFAL